jgi:hypothetical protein
MVVFGHTEHLAYILLSPVGQTSSAVQSELMLTAAFLVLGVAVVGVILRYRTLLAEEPVRPYSEAFLDTIETGQWVSTGDHFGRVTELTRQFTPDQQARRSRVIDDVADREGIPDQRVQSAMAEVDAETPAGELGTLTLFNPISNARIVIESEGDDLHGTRLTADGEQPITVDELTIANGVRARLWSAPSDAVITFMASGRTYTATVEERVCRDLLRVRDTNHTDWFLDLSESPVRARLTSEVNHHQGLNVSAVTFGHELEGQTTDGATMR